MKLISLQNCNRIAWIIVSCIDSFIFIRPRCLLTLWSHAMNIEHVWILIIPLIDRRKHIVDWQRIRRLIYDCFNESCHRMSGHGIDARSHRDNGFSLYLLYGNFWIRLYFAWLCEVYSGIRFIRVDTRLISLLAAIIHTVLKWNLAIIMRHQ